MRRIPVLLLLAACGSREPAAAPESPSGSTAERATEAAPATPPADPAVDVAVTEEATPAEAPADGTAWTASSEQQAMIRALSHRDGPPPCAEVEALASDPVPALLGIAENVQMPPWVPMHAASCLLTRHAAEAEPTLRAWVVDPERKGMALLVLGQLDQIPTDIAVGLAEAALAGPHADSARPRIEKAAAPEVRAVVAR